jgi:hypothetical protein
MASRYAAMQETGAVTNIAISRPLNNRPESCNRAIFRKARAAPGRKARKNFSRSRSLFQSMHRPLLSFFGGKWFPGVLNLLTSLRHAKSLRNRIFAFLHRPKLSLDNFPISSRIQLSYLVFLNPLAFKRSLNYFLEYFSTLSSACGSAPSRSRPYPAGFPHVNSYFVCATGRSPPAFNLPDFPNHVSSSFLG